MKIQTSKLPSGIQIATDQMTDLQTITLGFWVHTGARNETQTQNGISHFLEHMMFKGTKTRSAFDIANQIESVGGIINAHTSREMTAYYIKILKEDLPLAVNILCDMLQNSEFSNEELEKERGVILQEIAQSNDTPDDIIFDYFQEAAFPGQRIGRTILGPKERVSSFIQKDLYGYIQSHYHPTKIAFAACGNIDHQLFVDLISENLHSFKNTPTPKIEAANYQGGTIEVGRDIEQIHMLLGYKSVAYKDPLYFAQGVFSTLFGGGMSSRLFQEVREKRGLAYSVFCFGSGYVDAGIFGIYAGAAPEKKDALKKLLQAELERCQIDLSNDEFEKAKRQIIAAKSMALESTMARVEHAGSDLLTHGKIRDIEALRDKVKAVTAKDIQSLLSGYLTSTPTYAVLGKV